MSHQECHLSKDNIVSEFKLAQSLLDSHDINDLIRAFQIFQSITEMQDVNETVAKAFFNVALCYEYGIGTTRSLQEATVYYLLASQNGIDEGNNRAQKCRRKSRIKESKAERKHAANYVRMMEKCDEASYSNIKSLAERFRQLPDQASIRSHSKVLTDKSSSYSNNYNHQTLKNDADGGHVDAQLELGCMYYQVYKTEKSLKNAFNYFKLAADKNVGGVYSSSTLAKYNLALCFDKGQGVSQSDAEAYHYYKMAADRGYPEAIFQVGYMNFIGKGTEKSFGNAFDYFNIAALKNIPGANSVSTFAKVILGILYKERNKKRFYQEAFRYFKIAAAQGNSEGQFFVAECYELGIGTKRSSRNAIKYYGLVANEKKSGVSYIRAKALYRLGVYFKDTFDDYGRAIHYFETAAEEGYLEAIFELFLCYWKGLGVEKDITKSWELLQRLILSNDNGPRGFSTQAKSLAYENKEEFSIFFTNQQAQEYLQSAVQEENFRALLLMGRAKEREGFSETSAKEVFECYKLASTKHYRHPVIKEVYFELGRCYEQGYGTRQSYKKAFVCFKKAAHEGYPLADMKVAEYYEKGFGVSASLEQACKYYLLSHTPEGYLRAASCYEMLGIDYIEEQKECLHHYKKTLF